MEKIGGGVLVWDEPRILGSMRLYEEYVYTIAMHVQYGMEQYE